MAMLSKRKYCGHCKEYVSSSTYRRHREESLRNVRVKLDKYDDDDGTRWAASDSEVSCQYALVKDDFSELSFVTLYSIEAIVLFTFCYFLKIVSAHNNRAQAILLIFVTLVPYTDIYMRVDNE